MSGTKFCYEEAKDNCFRFEHRLPDDSGVPGGERQKSIVDCQNRCDEIQDCAWFSYNSDKPSGQNCFLKSEFHGEEYKKVGVYGPNICSGLNAICSITKRIVTISF